MASIGNDGRWLQPRPLLDAEKPKARLSGAGAIGRSRPEMSHFEIAGDKRISQHLSGTNLPRPKCKNQFRLRDRRVKFNQ
jgi:hypothetical protein